MPNFKLNNLQDLYALHDKHVNDQNINEAIKLSHELLTNEVNLHHYHRHIKSHILVKRTYTTALCIIFECINKYGIDQVTESNLSQIFILSSAEERQILSEQVLSEVLSNLSDPTYLRLASKDGVLNQAQLTVLADNLKILNKQNLGNVFNLYYELLLSKSEGDTERPNLIKYIWDEINTSKESRKDLILEFFKRYDNSDKYFCSDTNIVSKKDEQEGLKLFRSLMFGGIQVSDQQAKDMLMLCNSSSNKDIYIAITLLIIYKSFAIRDYQERRNYLLYSGIYNTPWWSSLLISKFVIMCSESAIYTHLKSQAKFAQTKSNAKNPENSNTTVQFMIDHILKGNSIGHIGEFSNPDKKQKDENIDIYLFGQVRMSSFPTVLSNINQIAKANSNKYNVHLYSWEKFPQSQIPKNLDELGRIIGKENSAKIKNLLVSQQMPVNSDSIEKIFSILSSKQVKSEEAILELSNLSKKSHNFSFELFKEQDADQLFDKNFDPKLADLPSTELRILKNQHKMWFLIKESIHDFLNNSDSEILILARNELGFDDHFLNILNETIDLISDCKYDIALDTEFNAHTIPPCGGVGDRFFIMKRNTAAILCNELPFNINKFNTLYSNDYPNLPHNIFMHHQYIHFLLAKLNLSCYFLPTSVCGGLDRGKEELTTVDFSMIENALTH